MARLATTSHLPARPPEEWREIGDQVAAVLDMPGWKVIADSIEYRQEQLRKQLTGSSPKETPQEYERIIGQMIGLDLIDTMIEGIKARAEEARDE